MQRAESGPSRLFQTGARVYFRTRPKSRGKQSPMTIGEGKRPRDPNQRETTEPESSKPLSSPSPGACGRTSTSQAAGIIFGALALHPRLGPSARAPRTRTVRALRSHPQLTPLDVPSRVHSTPPGLHTSAQTRVERSGSLPQTYASPRRVAPSRAARNEHRSPGALPVKVY
jgi:hypothetical protein